METIASHSVSNVSDSNTIQCFSASFVMSLSSLHVEERISNVDGSWSATFQKAVRKLTSWEEEWIAASSFHFLWCSQSLLSFHCFILPVKDSWSLCKPPEKTSWWFTGGKKMELSTAWRGYSLTPTSPIMPFCVYFVEFGAFMFPNAIKVTWPLIWSAQKAANY